MSFESKFYCKRLFFENIRMILIIKYKNLFLIDQWENFNNFLNLFINDKAVILLSFYLGNEGYGYFVEKTNCLFQKLVNDEIYGNSFD